MTNFPLIFYIQLCSNQNEGDVIAHPQDCRGYIVCLKTEPKVQYCEFGFHFDNKRKVCNWPENAMCQLSESEESEEELSSEDENSNYSTLMAIDIATGSIIDPMSGYDPENVYCRHFGAYFLPNPKQCRTYYLCAYGHIHQHSCGQGTLWSYDLQQCVVNHKANCYHKTSEEEQEIIDTLQSCNSGSTTTEKFHPTGSSYTRTTEALDHTTSIANTTTTTTTPTPTTKPPTTTASSTPLVFHPTGSSYTRPTPALHTPQHISSTKPPPVHSSKKPNSSNPFNIICPAKRQSYVAHPKDCAKYFMCIMGTPVLTSCPLGLYWDSKKEYCDLAEKVKCFQ